MKIGYVRVSTVEQNEARQMEALREEGVDKIYMDKKSGKDFNRPEYQKMIASLQKGDVLVIHSIDRLGRNYEEIIAEWRKITKEIEADIVVQDMPLLNTTQNKDLKGSVWACCPFCQKKALPISPETKIQHLKLKCKGSNCKKEFEVNI